MWAFKNGASQPATHAHADFAAVNVNVWLTPTTANLHQSTGGLTVYDVEAPSDWDFEVYNKQGHRITQYLAARNATGMPIPYRANRAIVFNSDLFHATQAVQFRPGYANRRVNVTMLFGRREDANTPR
jgi:hypothetical protein